MRSSSPHLFSTKARHQKALTLRTFGALPTKKHCKGTLPVCFGRRACENSDLSLDATDSLYQSTDEESRMTKESCSYPQSAIHRKKEHATCTSYKESVKSLQLGTASSSHDGLLLASSHISRPQIIDSHVQNISFSVNSNEKDLQVVSKACHSKELKILEQPPLVVEGTNNIKVLNYSSTPKKRSEGSNKEKSNLTASPKSSEPEFIKDVLDMLCSPILNSSNKRKKITYKARKKPENQFIGGTGQKENVHEKCNNLVSNGENKTNKVHESTEIVQKTSENCSAMHVNEHTSPNHTTHFETLDESINDISFNTLEAVCQASEKIAVSKILDDNNKKEDNYGNSNGKSSTHCLKSEIDLSLHEDVTKFEVSEISTGMKRKRPLLYSVKDKSILCDKKIRTCTVNMDDLLLDAKVLEVSNREAHDMKKKQMSITSGVELVPFTSLQSLDPTELNCDVTGQIKCENCSVSQNAFLHSGETCAVKKSKTYRCNDVDNIQINGSNASATNSGRSEYTTSGCKTPKETSIENSVPSLFITDTQIFQIGDEVESLMSALHNSSYNFDDNCFLSEQITEEDKSKSCTVKSEDEIYFNNKYISPVSTPVRLQDCRSSNASNNFLECQASNKLNSISENMDADVNTTSSHSDCAKNQNCIINDDLTVSRINIYNRNIGKCAEPSVRDEKIDGKYSKSEYTNEVNQTKIEHSENSNVEFVNKNGNTKKESNLLASQMKNECSVITNKKRECIKTSVLYTAHGKQAGMSDWSLIKGFQTVSGKEVSVSKELFAEAEIFFSDDIVVQKESVKKGSQTASRKQVGISDQSSAKAKKVLICDENTGDKELVPKSFQTASGKQVTVSKESLAKAKVLLCDENTVEKEPFPKGFQTASGKQVTVSKESLAKAKVLLCDENMVEKEPFAKGFQTASGKQVTVSKESLAKAKVLLCDETTVEKEPFPKGFQTASGKQVSVSKESLEEAKMLFIKDIVVEKETDTKGFQTTRGKQVNVPEKSLARANFSFNNEDVVWKVPITNSFLTGHDSHARISDESLNNTSYIGKKTSFMKDSAKPDYISENSNSAENFVVSSKNLALSPQSTETVSLAVNTNDTTATLFGVTDDLDIPLSLVHEVSEITAAFLADEETSSSFDAPDWLKMYVTSPSTIQDRFSDQSSIVCYENEINNIKKSSPHLGYSDRFVKRKEPISSVAKENQNSVKFCHTNTPGFRPPFNTSTPVDNMKNEIKKRKTENRCFYAPFSKRQKLFCSSSAEQNSHTINYNVTEMRKKAAEQQQLVVESGKLCKSVTRCKGSHLLRKQTESGTPLHEIVNGQPPKQMPINEILELGIKKSITEVTSNNAVNFRFSADDYYSHEMYSKNVSGIPVGDGALLILDSNHTAGVEEVTRCFLSSPGINPSLISSQWVCNHYKWIILKMACTERSYPYIFGNRYLTPNNLLLQLRYRYDREIDQGQRPALRKILEKDESAAKPVVLFVSSIISIDSNEAGVKYELELSDGWYSVIASIDHEMAALVYRKVFVGTKLLLCGAELLNCDDGCDPLNMNESVRLKISTNSVRRARWYTKLGFCNILPSIPGHLSSVLPRGGSVYSLTACVARVYPLLYIEKQKDGKTITRSERAEFKESDSYQHRKEELVDVICSQVQKELEQESHNFLQLKRTVLEKDISRISNPEELCAFVECAPEPQAVQKLLSEDQMQLVREHKQKRVDLVYQQLQDRVQKQLDEQIVQRVVTPLMKVRLMEPDYSKKGNAVLSIWRPSEEIINLLNEGVVVKFCNIIANGYNRNGELLLSVTPHTQYEFLSKHTDIFSERSVLKFSCCTSDFAPLFSEVDIVGIVIEVSALCSSGSQIVYVADADFNLFGITFWDNLKALYYDDLLVPSVVVAASNLQWCQGTVSWNIPCAYAKETSSFTTDPHQKHLKQALQALKSQVKIRDGSQYISKCSEKLHRLLNIRNTGGAVSYPLKSHSHETGSHSENMTVSGNCKSGSVSSEQYVNVSKIYECNNEQLLHQSNKKLTPLRRKICKLEKYGEPPPVSPLATVINSKLKKEFRCPAPVLPAEVSPKPYITQKDSDFT